MVLSMKKKYTSFFIFISIFAILVLLTCTNNSNAMHIGPGTIVSHELWEFVTKFAFTYALKPGQVIGAVKGVVRVHTPAYLVIYDDQEFSWNHIYNNESLTCDFALLPRSKGGPLVSKYKLLPHKDNLIEIKITEHLRPRLWYFAIVTAKCDAKKETKKQRAIDLHNLHWLDDGAKSTELKLGKIFVDLTITNINQGYEKHFSFDEEGMLPITFVFLFIYIICFTGQCFLQPKINFDSRARTTRNTRNQYRKSINTSTGSNMNGDDQRPYLLVKLWSILVMLEMGALLFRTVDLLFYAHSGEEATKFRWSRLLTLQLFGWMMDIGSQLGLALLVLLVAKGWTITSNEIRGRRTLFCFIGAMIIATCLLYAWAAVDWDPASTYYIYESFPGILVILLRLIMFMWFLRSLLETYRLETMKERKLLYKIVAGLYSLWFLSLPLIVLAAYLLDPWYRSKVVRTMSYSAHAIALLCFGILFWPSRAEKYFNVNGGIQDDNRVGGREERKGLLSDESL